MIIPVVVFAVVLGVVFGVFYAFVQKPEMDAKGTVMRRLAGKSPRPKGKRVSVLRNDSDVTAFDPFDQAMERMPGMARSLATRLQQAGLEVTPGALLLVCLISGLVTQLLLGMMFGYGWISFSLALVATQLPLWYVRFKGGRRVRTFEEQFPEAIDLIARAMRAGHAFTTAVAMVCEEAPQPVAGEFKRLSDEQNFGKPLPDAMRDFANRIPLLDAKFFVTAVLTQRQSGGNLSEVLDNLARVIRERFRVKRQIRVVSAHGRMTGVTLVALPPVLALFFVATVPNHFTNLVNDPAGQTMIIAAVVLQIVGSLIIRKLIDIEY